MFPAAGFVLQDLAAGREAFKVMRAWNAPPLEGNGVDVSFVDDTDNGSYSVILSPNVERLIERNMGPGAREDYDVMPLTAVIAKSFPGTGRLPWLRSAAADRPLLIAPIGLGQEGWQDGFLKDAPKVLDRKDVADGSIEQVMVARATGRERHNEQRWPPPRSVPSPKETDKRRKAQLKRFFTVTLARIRQNQRFSAAKAGCSGIPLDRIEQAACNIVNWHRHSSDVTGTAADALTMFEVLRRTPEQVADRSPALFEFDAVGLRGQIHRDAEYLSAVVAPEATGDPIEILNQRGYWQVEP
jgi:hypothetical protein